MAKNKKYWKTLLASSSDKKHAEADQYDAKTRTSAEDYAKQVKEKLYADSKVIESNIDGLKQFENQYRARLTDFLTQLTAQVSDSDNYNVDKNSSKDGESEDSAKDAE